MTGWDDLKPGTRYRVTFDDCCVQGHFEDMFVGPEPDEDGDPHVLVFEHARIGPEWGRYEFSEVVVT